VATRDDTVDPVSVTAREVALPELSLVLLIGASGSGKTTFARAHFAPFEAVSADFCRGLVSNDETDQSVNAAAFEVLNTIVAQRLAAGRLTVVDATSVQPAARASLVNLARDHDVLPVGIVFDLPERVLLERNAHRGARAVPEGSIRRQRDQLRQALRRGLAREGLRGVHVLHSQEDADQVEIVREPLYSNRRSDHGPFDIVGDVHGCLNELLALLDALGYEVERDEAGRPCDATHPEGRRVIFLGDLVDRGPDVVGVLRLAMGMTRRGHALAVPGNHEAKLVRALRRGGPGTMTMAHGLDGTLAALAQAGREFTEEARAWCEALTSHYVLDDGALVVAHAGLKEAYQGRASRRVREFALYGDTTGESDEYGLPVRYPWADDYRGSAMVVYGHTTVPEPVWVNNTLCVDTGCVFGGTLTALRYPSRKLVSVPAARVYWEPARPLVAPPEATPRPSTRAGDMLDITDVLGRRHIETAYLGRVAVPAERAAGALEVMSRFALSPRLLAYLPPTMSPVATAKADGFLEHPAEAFDYFSGEGVDEVICERKHMGSRAVIWVFRDEDAAVSLLGAARRGVIHTRLGRAFFEPLVEAEVLARVAGAIAAAGLWEEWEADWALLDAEILPWSLKADDLIRRQYLAVGASARSSLGASLEALRQVAARGLAVADLCDHVSDQGEDVEAYTRVVTSFAWPTRGLEGVRVAPFQVLATSGEARYGADHRWHLAVAERLVAAQTGEPLLIPTPSLVVRTGDADSRDEGVCWWTDLTAGGGEGMVVKPVATPARGRAGLVQPGLKVRGPEYLRVTYGPDYRRPANLARLRDRQLARKRSLALREYALGLEAIDRLVAGEPLWRVHEAVFAVLALESEPVDPRL